MNLLLKIKFLACYLTGLFTDYSNKLRERINKQSQCQSANHIPNTKGQYSYCPADHQMILPKTKNKIDKYLNQIANSQTTLCSINNLCIYTLDILLTILEWLMYVTEVLFLCFICLKLQLISSSMLSANLRQINIQKLVDLIDQDMNCQRYIQIFKEYKEKYKLNFSYEKIENIIEKAQKINDRQAGKSSKVRDDINPSPNECFAFGEFKIFTWVLVRYCHKYSILLEQMNDKHYRDIGLIFQSKSSIFIQYQILCVINEKKKYTQDWKEEQIQLLKDIIESRDSENQWRLISFQLFTFSKKRFYRPLQQCRQKWFNHLNPIVKKGDWTIQEDIQLLSAIESLGCKWAVISRDSNGVRTEHMIKNRYHSLVNKWKKKHQKTNPKRIVFYLLKYLKEKIKRENTKHSQNGQFSNMIDQKYEFSDEKQQKPKKQHKTSHKTPKIEPKLIIQVQKICQTKQIQQVQHVQPLQTQPFEQKSKPQIDQAEEQSQFDIGMDIDMNIWQDNFQEVPQEHIISQMVYRKANYENVIKISEEKKTRDTEQVEEPNQNDNQYISKEIKTYDDFGYESFDYQSFNPFSLNHICTEANEDPGYEKYQYDCLLDSQWFRELEEKNNLDWMDNNYDR